MGCQYTSNNMHNNTQSENSNPCPKTLRHHRRHPSNRTEYTFANKINDVESNQRHLFKQAKGTGGLVEVGMSALVRQTVFGVFAIEDLEAGTIAELILHCLRVFRQVDQFFTKVVEDLFLLGKRPMVVVVVVAVVIVVLVELGEVFDPGSEVGVALSVGHLGDELSVH